jgi:regulation of enolase protein 1 (concanavalin A-like superfamily)
LPRAYRHYGLGRVYLARGERAQALEQFQEARAVALAGSWRWWPELHELAGPLNAAEEVNPSQASHPNLGQRAEGRDLLDELIVHLEAGRAWHDPLGDCRFAIGNGLEIYAPNGRDLWYLNLSAPRALVERSGDLAAQAVCGPVSGQQPAIGGLLLWADKRNYLRLDRGVFGPRDVSLVGCLENEDVIIGCIGLPVGAAERVYLRLVRVGGRVEAHGSADGETWYTVGEAAFPVEDPVQVGVHAIGSIDRSIYPGAYPEGTAIRFESFGLWEM